MDAKHAAILIVVLAVGTRYLSRNDFSRDILADKVGEEYDYVIVGGGSAGCVLAARLSEDRDSSVLLLEAGGFYDEDPSLHIPSDWISLLQSKYDWGYYTATQSESSRGLKNNQQHWGRGKVLGGSSILNAMQYTRGSPYDYDQWAANGCTGWSYKEVLPYFLKSEDIQIPELKSSKYHNSGGPMAVSSGSLKTKIASTLLAAGQELGYDVTDYNSANIEGFSELQLSVRNGVRESTGVAFLGGTADRDNLDISIDSFVTKINIQNKKAAGVWFIKDNRKHYVRARKEVIVSAGAINSPQLLMLSGIGPKEHLDQFKVPVVVDLPVGQNLQDHQLVILSSTISQPESITIDWQTSWVSKLQYALLGTGVKATSGNEVTGYITTDTSEAGKANPDVFFFTTSAVFPADGMDGFNIMDNVANEYFFNGSSTHGFTTLVFKTHPKSRGTIRLSSVDPFDFPVIDPQYLTDQSDVGTMIAGIRVWEKLLTTKAMKEIGANMDHMRMSFCSHHEFRSDNYWECIIRHMATSVFHHCGTCKMGDKNDPTAVVDPELRVKGIKGLRVVDTSIFPNVTAGNTNAPVIMVAEKAADLIRGKDTVSHLRM